MKVFKPCLALVLCSLILGSPSLALGQDKSSDSEKNQPSEVLRIHYQDLASSKTRPTKFGLWIWQEGEKGRLLRSSSKDSQGLPVYEIPLENEHPLYILPRSLSSKKTIWDQPTRSWTKKTGKEIWLRRGDPKIHRSAVGRRFVSAAYADKSDALYLVMKGSPDQPSDLKIVDDQGRRIAISQIHIPSPRRQGFIAHGDQVTFIYDASFIGGNLDPGRGVYVAGNFNGWQKAVGKSKWKLKWDDAKKIWSVTVKASQLPSNALFKFKQKKGAWAPNGGNLQIKHSQGFRADLTAPLSFDRRYQAIFKDEKQGVDIIPRGWLHDTLHDYQYQGSLGANYSKEGTQFAVFAPTASKVEVLLYTKAQGGQGEVVSLRKQDQYTWTATQPGDLAGRYYMLRVDAPGTNPLRPVIDPYSRCNTAHNGRGIIVNLRATDPEGFRKHSRPNFLNVTEDAHPNSPEDAIIYEAHVRDFSIAKNSGIKARGQYLGFIEKGSKGPGGVKTGIDHLLELGITHVQIMPLQDFDNNESGNSYNWGYMPVHFNSPDGWYASKKDDVTRVTEAKELIYGLHKAGLRMVLDVVYNHTSSAASFDKIVPYYYYRMKPFNDYPYWNGSGCGNEFRSESAMGRKFILDSIRYWIEEYKVDGFRFDLMGLIDTETMRQIASLAHSIDKTLLVYGEPWAGGDTPIQKTEKGSQQGQGFGVFNDILRDAIKGGNHDGAKGFIQNPNPEHSGKIKNGLEGATNRSAGGFALSPKEVINYVACHDNKTLWDKLSEDRSANPAMRARMQRLAGAMVILSQGVPFIHGGQEFHRSKGGEHNSYNKPDRINKVDWSLKAKNKATFNFYRGLIALRKAHPAFRLSDSRKIAGQRLQYLPAAKSVIAFELEGKNLKGEQWDHIVVIFNASRSPETVNLPGSSWTVVVDENEAGNKTVKNGSKRVKSQVKVPPMSVVVLHD
ncbi:MAG: type I pullulanase [Planctomycetota bacterium]|nr:type I pullulanase [Planctomycetota bacterium]